MTEATAAPAEKTLFGHPPKLFILFSTEMWERFGYYGMRAILLLYLTKHFLFEQKEGVAIYTAYVSLVYLTPLIGGLVADKLLGSRNAVKLGAVFMAIGYFMLSFGGPQTTESIVYGGQAYPVVAGAAGTEAASNRYLQTPSGARLQIGPAPTGGIALTGESQIAGLPNVMPAGSYEKKVDRNAGFMFVALLALAIIIIGNGFFKPNISTMVGDLYSPSDKRRDAAFTIFYMGINTGSLLGQILLPNLRAAFGFSIPFLAAAIGMSIGLIITLVTDRRMAQYGAPPNPERLRRPAMLGLPLGWLIMALAAIAVIPVYFLLSNDPGVGGVVLGVTPEGLRPFIQKSPVVGWLLMGGGTLAFLTLLGFSLLKLKAVEQQRMIVALTLTFFSIFFWALFEQAGTSLTLFADQNTDRHILGWNMPPEQAHFFNPLFIVLLAPLFSIMWAALAKRGLEPSTPVKFAIGLMMAGLGFLVLVLGSGFASPAALVGLQWLVLTYLIHTVGELMLSPVGLSMITRLSVPRLVGLMMGAWYLASAMAQYLGGIIAQFMASETIGGKVLDPHLSMQKSVEVFTKIGFVAVGVGVLLLVLSPVLKAWMHEGKTAAGEPAAPDAIPEQTTA
jgi:POT family proton-dependent oligopeptide transporter